MWHDALVPVSTALHCGHNGHLWALAAYIAAILFMDSYYVLPNTPTLYKRPLWRCYCYGSPNGICIWARGTLYSLMT